MQKLIILELPNTNIGHWWNSKSSLYEIDHFKCCRVMQGSGFLHQLGELAGNVKAKILQQDQVPSSKA